MMIFQQFFDTESSTYSYLLADVDSKEAIIIDPVDHGLSDYLAALAQQGLTLRYALETHIHADHVTAADALRTATQCQTALGSPATSACVSEFFQDGSRFVFGRYQLTALYTPGHTDDSYSFYLQADGKDYLFTGDTLLIRGTGRTDFQNGDASAQYHSLQRLLAFSDATLVYPAHDYNGATSSTIAAEKAWNPRLQVADEAAYVALMAELRLPNPKLMDIAVPANRACGRSASA